MSYPLEGIRVLDMSRVLAGPFAGRMLADLGAEVVKVEPPEGDVTRLWGAKINGMSGYFNQQNVGKRGMCIDLKQPQGAALVKQLACQADVVIENFRPGVMDKLGVGYDVLSAENPNLVMLSISGFGANGPESDRAAYAPIIHAEVGFVERQSRYSDAKHADIAMSVADTNASLHGLVALLSALLMRAGSGAGQHIDMAMVDATIVTDDAMHFALDDVEHLRDLQNEVHATAAGPLMLAGDFRFLWHQLSKHCGVTDGSTAQTSLADKIAARRRAAHIFFNETCTDRQTVIQALDKMNVAWGDVRSAAASQQLPTVQHRASFVAVSDRGEGSRFVPQSPYRFSAAQAGVRGVAPHKGEHNREVLDDWLGYSDEQMEQFSDVLISKIP